MAISLTYLRPFYPQHEGNIRRSPYGRAYVRAPWAGDEAWELEIEGLLDDVKKTHGIPHAVRYVADPNQRQPDPSVPVESSDDVYRELAAKGGGLSGTRRTHFDRDLRDSRGKVSPGHVLLVEVDGALRWYEGPWLGWHVRIVHFLDGLLRLGPAYVEDKLRLPETFAVPPSAVVDRIAGMADSPAEGETLRSLLLSGILGSGEPEGQVPVGRRLLWGRHGVTHLPRSGLKFVDLVHLAGPETAWVVEAKEVLDWSALGQALGYASLYEEDYVSPELGPGPKVAVHPAIACREVDETVLYCAEVRGVAVFADGERRA